MLITNQGFNSQLLSPELARLLGDGSGIMAEASLTNSELIESVHFLGYMAKTGGTVMRVEFLESRRINPERFCEHLYDAALDEERPQGMPTEFSPRTLSPASHSLLEVFEKQIAERKLGRGNEELFMLVLFGSLDSLVCKILVAAIGSEEAYKSFCNRLEARANAGVRGPVNLFGPDGAVVQTPFDKSGRRVLSMLREETASLGYRKATVMHLLYALVGIENGIMQRALQYQAIDPIRDIHGFLTRELTRPGAKRINDFELNRSTMHDSVTRVLEGAANEARRDGMPIGEVHVARALAGLRSGVVADFFVSRKVNLDVLREYLARAENEVEEVGENLRIPVREIEAELQKRILGQDQAIRQILPWITRLRFKFPRERGAAAVLLFLGPSGTGKTQLAKELARTIYGSEDDLLMLEMGQFNAKESINIFIGSPPGYVGYGEGKLTNGLRDKPESVVLFDEIEKAHEDVWVALLRFLDEGLISDPAGPTRDGRRCIIVLTSNLGADTLAQQIPSSTEESTTPNPALEQAIRDTVLRYLKHPEIYNRVDDKVIFRPFIQQTYQQLVTKQVKIETNKFLDLRGTQVDVMPDVITWLAARASDAKAEGARCVPRLVNRFIVAPIIDLLTRNEDRVIPKVVLSMKGEGIIAEEA